MKTLIVDTLKKEIDFMPRTLEAEITQNVRTILSTYKHSVPLDRRFGVEGAIIDNPVIGESGALLQSDIFEAIKKYEPRVNVEEIGFTADTVDPSKVYPRIILSIKGG
ncbi:GPW/gp25 family protein [Veillonella caviae]|uniref:GPW/gp25 family protein n=1 Tax=Veillonella caviae TaxID=248316 RepID=UPI002A915A34|nr:GPW/gp25 family protein [Veillonella caviae]MDY5253971.1 GPW/gp25 family protein [Veillonella caviae]